METIIIGPTEDINQAAELIRNMSKEEFAYFVQNTVKKEIDRRAEIERLLKILYPSKTN